MLWIVVKTLGCGTVVRSVVDGGNWSGISVESCTRSQNQGIPGQSWVIRMMRQVLCLILWITL